MRFKLLVVLVMLVGLFSGCGDNQNRINDKRVKATWSEVLDHYKSRADVVPNLVAVVQGYAGREQEALTRVTEASASVAGIKATPELIDDPTAFAKFQKAQSELGIALSRLLVVSENYPQLRADAKFRYLLSQLVDTESRITVARNRYIKAVEEYNDSLRSFPNSLTAMAMGWKVKASFTAGDEQSISTPPPIR